MSVPDSDHIVSKSNSLVRASYRLSLHAQHLILQAVSRVRGDKPAFDPRTGKSQLENIKVTAAEFAEMWHIPKKEAYKELKLAANDLYDQSIIEVDGKRTDKFRWVSHIAYHDGEGWAELTFSQKVAPYITNLRGKFTKYRIGQVQKLRSTYSIRLFEWIVQFIDTGWMYVTVEEMNSRLGLDYKRWHDLKRKVIDPSINELEAKSNIEITYQLKKIGKKIVGLRFEFNEAAQQPLDLEPPLNLAPPDP